MLYASLPSPVTPFFVFARSTHDTLGMSEYASHQNREKVESRVRCNLGKESKKQVGQWKKGRNNNKEGRILRGSVCVCARSPPSLLCTCVLCHNSGEKTKGSKLKVEVEVDVEEKRGMNKVTRGVRGYL